MMFKTYKLACDPFGEMADARFFFESAMHVRAFRVAASALEKKRLILITGAAGCGKSLLGQCLLLKMGPRNRPVRLSCAPGDHSTLSERLRRACDGPDATNSSVVAAVAALRSHVKAGSSSRLVLIVDQAEHLPKSVIKELVDLIRGSDRPDDLPVRVLLIGYAEVARAVFEVAGDDKSIARIGPLANLNHGQVASYIQHRWTVAGGTESSPFSKEAMQLIAERTAGNPRCINRLCTLLLSHVAHDRVPIVNADMIDQVLTAADPDVLRADVSKSEHDTTKGSSDMPDSSKDATRIAAQPPTAAKNPPVYAESNVTPVPVVPVSGDKALQLFSLVERLERALAGAPAVISSIESAMAEPKQLLKRCDDRAGALKRHHDSFAESLGGLEDTCAKAEQLQHSLAQSVDQLTGIGDASQEKVTLLLDTLELGNKTRQELDSTIREHSQTSLRIETTAAECERRLSESAQSLTSAQERSHRSLVQNMKSVHTTLLAPFGEKGEQISRLEEVISGGITTLSSRANEQKREVESAARRHVREIESKLSEHQARLATTADKIADKAAARIIRMIQTKQETLDSEIDRRLAAFGPTGEHTVRLDQLVERGVAALKTSGDEQTRAVGDTIESSLSRFESTVHAYEQRASETAGEHTVRLDQLVERGVAAIKTSGEEQALAFSDTTESSLSRFESAIQAYEKRSSETSRKVASQAVDDTKEAIENASKKLKQAADEYLLQMRDSTDAERKQIASELTTTEQRLRAIAENTEEANKILNTLIQNRDVAYEKRLGEVAEASSARVMETIDAKCEAVEKELSRRLASFAPTGEETVHLTKLISDGVNTIRRSVEDTSRDVQESLEHLRKECELETAKYETKLVEVSEEIIDAAVKRMQEHTQARREELSDEIERRVAAFGPTGEHAVRLAELVSRGVETITGATEEGRRAMDHGAVPSHTAGAGSTTSVTGVCDAPVDKDKEQVSAALGSSEEHEARFKDVVERGIATINTAAEERVREITDRSQPRLDRLTSTLNDLDKRAADLTNHAVGEIVKTSNGEVQKLKSTAVEQIASFVEATESANGRLTSQIQGAKEAARMVSESTQKAHSVLDTLVKNRESVECQITKLSDEAEKAAWAAAQLEELQTTVEPAVKELRQSMQGIDAANQKTERLIEEVWSLTTTAEQRARDIRECFTSSAEIIERLTSAQRRTEQTAISLDKNTERAEDMRGQLDQAVTQAQTTMGDVNRVCQGAAEATSKAAEAAVSARAGQDALTRRIKKAEEAAAEIDGAGRTADETTERLGELVDVVTGHVERQEAAADRCEEAIRRVDIVCEAAAHISDNVASRMEQARVQEESITRKISRTDEILTAAQEVNTNLSSQTESAEEALRNQHSAAEAHRKAIDELQRLIERGIQQTKSWEERHASGTKLGEQLESACSSATQISRQIKTLVARLIEKRDVYENNERALAHCIERANALGAKLQQIQTRGDAFELQLGGMLAEPRKMVDEAKTQTTQLNAVCSVVRKIFSGLSKTSLQANRDISRFADISREANTRLDELTEESKRASQTLCEWVDEAAHAQSRLAKSLLQVPSIERTHPTSTLAGLARASSRDIPDILSTAPTRRVHKLPPQNGPADRLGGKTDVATLIRDAERIAEVVD